MGASGGNGPVSPYLMFKTGEGEDYLSTFTRMMRDGDVSLDRRRHTAKVRVFTGSWAR